MYSAYPTGLSMYYSPLDHCSETAWAIFHLQLVVTIHPSLCHTKRSPRMRPLRVVGFCILVRFQKQEYCQQHMISPFQASELRTSQMEEMFRVRYWERAQSFPILSNLATPQTSTFSPTQKFPLFYFKSQLKPAFARR